MESQQDGRDPVWLLKEFARSRRIAPSVALSDAFYQRMVGNVTDVMNNMTLTEVSRIESLPKDTPPKRIESQQASDQLRDQNAATSNAISSVSIQTSTPSASPQLAVAPKPLQAARPAPVQTTTPSASPQLALFPWASQAAHTIPSRPEPTASGVSDAIRTQSNQVKPPGHIVNQNKRTPNVPVAFGKPSMLTGMSMLPKQSEATEMAPEKTHPTSSIFSNDTQTPFGRIGNLFKTSAKTDAANRQSSTSGASSHIPVATKPVLRKNTTAVAMQGTGLVKPHVMPDMKAGQTQPATSPLRSHSGTSGLSKASQTMPGRPDSTLKLPAKLNDSSRSKDATVPSSRPSFGTGNSSTALQNVSGRKTSIPRPSPYLSTTPGLSQQRRADPTALPRTTSAMSGVTYPSPTKPRHVDRQAELFFASDMNVPRDLSSAMSITPNSPQRMNSVMSDATNTPDREGSAMSDVTMTSPIEPTRYDGRERLYFASDTRSHQAQPTASPSTMNSVPNPSQAQLKDLGFQKKQSHLSDADNHQAQPSTLPPKLESNPNGLLNTLNSSITSTDVPSPAPISSGRPVQKPPFFKPTIQPPRSLTGSELSNMNSPTRRTPSDGFNIMSGAKRFKPSSPTRPPVLTPEEVLLGKLGNARHAHDVLRLLRSDDLSNRPLRNASLFNVYWPDDILDLVRGCVTAAWKYEMDQAEAALQSRHDKSKPRVTYQPLHDYCGQPKGYKDEDLTDSVRDIRRHRQQAQSMNLRTRGLESWVSPLSKRIQTQLEKNGKKEKDAKDLAFEIVMGGIGEVFPARWKRQLQEEFWSDDELTLLIATDEKKTTSNTRMFKLRRLRYYGHLEQLRLKGLEYLFLGEDKGLFTTLTKIADLAEHLIPCAEAFKDIVRILSARAWAAVEDDFSGRHETVSSALKGKTYGVVSAQDKAAWNNEAGFWASIGDCELYNDTHPIPPIGLLPSSAAVFKYGYLGQADTNMAYAVMPLQIRSSIELCAIRMMPCGSFVGVYPTKCIFNPTQPEDGKLFSGPEKGLYMDDDGCRGLMSYMAVVKDFKHGNVIAAWDRYIDAKAPQLISWRLLLFTCRPVKFGQPLVLWDTMRGATG
jgi:hypothetical protein